VAIYDWTEITELLLRFKCVIKSKEFALSRRFHLAIQNSSEVRMRSRYKYKFKELK